MAKKQDGYQPPADKKMRGPKGRGSKFASAYRHPKGKPQEWPWNLNSSKGKQSSDSSSSSNGGSKKSSPTTTGKNNITYVIKSGDTLGAIAKKHGVSLSDLTRINNIKDANKIIAGKSIRIPKTATGNRSGSSSAGRAGKPKLTKKTSVTKKPRSTTVTREVEAQGREDWPVGPMSGGGPAGPGMTPVIPWYPDWGWGEDDEGSQASEPDVYVIQKGDTIGDIADKLGINYLDLIEMNQLENPNIIHPGEVLKLPLPPRGKYIPEVQGEPSARVRAAAPYYKEGRYVGRHNPMPPAMTHAGMSLPGVSDVESTILARKHGGKLLGKSDVNSMFSW